MKCWRSGAEPGVSSLTFGEFDRPRADDRTMIVEVHAAALNFADLLMIDDKYQIRPPRPFTPGQELSGVVVEAPEGCGWAEGDRVASKAVWGAFAEYAAVQPEMAIAVPDGLELTKAAALPVVYTTSIVALHECVATGPESTVLVLAAGGGIGLASLQIAKAAGARVLAAASNATKLHVAKAHGADELIDYTRPDWVEMVKQATDGLGADIIVDPVGGDIAQQSLRCIARDGTLLIAGFASGTIPQLPANRLLLKRAAAKGVYWDHVHDGEMLARVNSKMSDLLAEGRIDPVVDDSLELKDLPQALEKLSQRKVLGKMVLRTEAGKAAN